MKSFLPRLLATVTRHPRHRPDFEWSKLVTYNFFRLVELIFGRKNGIRAEASARVIKENGEQKIVYAFHTWEATLCYFEAWIRGSFSVRIPLKIYIPILKTSNGIPVFASPYLFAIAFDAVSARQVVSGNISFSYTVTGTNPYLYFSSLAQNSDTLSSATYAGASMTTNDSGVSGQPSVETCYVVVKNAPATGSNTLAANYSAAHTHTLTAASFSGVSQSGQPEANGQFQSGAASSFTASATVATNNAWLMGYARTQNSQTAGSNTLIRSADTTDNCIDSNATQATGSRSMNVTSSSGYGIIFTGSVAPFVAVTANSNFFPFL